MTQFLWVLFVPYALSPAISADDPSPDSETKTANPFFAFCMDTHDSQKRTLREQAEMLKELGFDGAGHLWLDDLEERIQTLDEFGLKLFQVYFRVNVDPDKEPYDSRLKDSLPLLAGRDVMLALLIGGLPPSDTSGDPKAVEIVREIADMASKYGVRVTLYPHSGDWLERLEDAVRITQKVDRPNVGAMFNLSHWLKVDAEENLKPLLTQSGPYLFAVSLNGADRAEEIRAGTGNFVRPLDSGSYDVRLVLDTLKSLDYQGPIGLQCWGIEGDAREHLARSMAAWRDLSGRP
jgi:sugar phosphate isomerase/epimerase